MTGGGCWNGENGPGGASRPEDESSCCLGTASFAASHPHTPLPLSCWGHIRFSQLRRRDILTLKERFKCILFDFFPHLHPKPKCVVKKKKKGIFCTYCKTAGKNRPSFLAALTTFSERFVHLHRTTMTWAGFSDAVGPASPQVHQSQSQR